MAEALPIETTNFAVIWRPKLELALTEAIGNGDPFVLFDAMRYAVLGRGKRLRPLLVLAACQAAGGDSEKALPGGVAIELVHAFSLVHDDLPCMDDDDTRRGRPTCHRVYGEAVALLAGDALLARAFGILATLPSAVGCVAEVADAVSHGMVPGQVFDMMGESDAISLDVAALHQLKSARLFISACRVGALIAQANSEGLQQLSKFGGHFGLGFQILDDLLDSQDDRRDVSRTKLTYPGRYGAKETLRLALEEFARADAALKDLGDGAASLRELVVAITGGTCDPS